MATCSSSSIAPNGSVAILYYKPGDTNKNLTNVTFSDRRRSRSCWRTDRIPTGLSRPITRSAALNGGPVNGTYTLFIDNYSYINSGTLLSWSISVNSTKLGLQFQTGAGMDQNADGTSDQNPLTTPFTGLTPGDAYMAPMPQPDGAVHVQRHQHSSTRHSIRTRCP